MKTDYRYVAQEYVASSLEAEVSGSVLLALLDNLKADEIRPILDDYRLLYGKLDPNKWYPQQAVLDIQKAIAERQVNVTENLVAIGMKAAEHFPFAPEVQTIEQAVAAFDAIAKQTHRHIPDTESVFVVETRPGRIVVVSNSPYPADNIFGVLWAMAKRFKPARASFTVHRIKNPNPDQCPGTAFEIDWN